MTKFDKRPLLCAFREMRRRGLLAEMNWTCCQTCGVAEMQSVADECPEDRRPAGYVFYHEQDAESLEESGSSMLAFGGLYGTADVIVGRVAFECLLLADVTAVWDGSERRRIEFRLPELPKRKAKK